MDSAYILAAAPLWEGHDVLVLADLTNCLHPFGVVVIFMIVGGQVEGLQQLPVGYRRVEDVRDFQPWGSASSAFQATTNNFLNVSGRAFGVFEGEGDLHCPHAVLELQGSPRRTAESEVRRCWPSRRSFWPPAGWALLLDREVAGGDVGIGVSQTRIVPDG